MNNDKPNANCSLIENENQQTSPLTSQTLTKLMHHDVEASQNDSQRHSTEKNSLNLRTQGGFSKEDVNISMLSVNSESSYFEQSLHLSLQDTSEQPTMSLQSNVDKPFQSKLKKVLIGADDIIPLFAYCLIKSQIPLIHTEIAFIDAFLDEENELTEAGSCFSTLRVAVEALQKGVLPGI